MSGLVLIDPFLVDSVGFQLSVGASLAILLVAPLLAEVVPGPRLFVEPLAVTVAAQVGVAPIMLATFGPVSLSTIPANLLAGPAAGVVMTWGLSVGIVASWLPDVVAGVVQWPAGLLVRWIGGVASWAARWPLPTIGPRLGIGLACAGLAGWFVRVHTGRGARLAQLVVTVVAVVALVVAVPAPPSTTTDYGSMVYFPASGPGEVSVLVVTGPARMDALAALVGDRVREVDVVVTTTGGYTARLAIDELAGALVVGSILGPPLHQIRGAVAVDGVVKLAAAGGVVVVASGDDRTRLAVSFDPH
ncbi:MAG: ComEC/Rec2 family competence protein [Acidimicrobiales bacterium]